MAKTRKTIGDVAKAANVSVGTVSHVLSGKKGVSKALRQRVEDAMRQFDYVPNIHAQGLKLGRSKVIGLCLPHGSTSYMNDLANELEAATARSDYRVLHIFGRQDRAIELQRVRDLLRFKIDGMVLFPSSHPEPVLDFLMAHRVPTVMIDRSNGDLRFDQITLDNARAMQDAVDYLIRVGHRRILFIYMSSQLSVTQERRAGLRTAAHLAQHEIEPLELEFGGDDDRLREGVSQALQRSDPPTAMIVSNSYQAATLITILRDMGVGIPSEVSVVSFDETEWSHLVSPPLSTIRQPARSLATTAWQLLTDRIESPNAAPRIMSMRAEFIPRGSVAPPRDMFKAGTKLARPAAARASPPVSN